MAKDIFLNDTLIPVEEYRNETENGLHRIAVVFNVASEDYHDIATLLYESDFDVKVPESGLAFRGKIQEYSTSVTNLYEKGQVAEYRLVLLEVQD